MWAATLKIGQIGLLRAGLSQNFHSLKATVCFQHLFTNIGWQGIDVVFVSEIARYEPFVASNPVPSFWNYV